MFLNLAGDIFGIGPCDGTTRQVSSYGGRSRTVPGTIGEFQKKCVDIRAGETFDMADIEGPDHVGVLDLGRQARAPLAPLELIGGEVGSEDLEREQALEAFSLAEEDLRPAAFAEGRDDLIGTKLAPRPTLSGLPHGAVRRPS